MPAAAEKVALTDRFLRALKPTPAGKRRTIWDVEPGLAVQVGARGRPSFYAVRRRPGNTQPTWHKMGDYPTMGLAEARDEVRKTLRLLTKGQDPKAVKAAKRQAEKTAERERAAGTFEAVAEQFFTWYRTTPSKRGGLRRRPEDTVATIRREFVPLWGPRPIGEIARRDVIAAIQGILDRGRERAAPGSRRADGGPYAARHAFAAARLLFGWAAHRELIPADPCARIKAAELHGAPEARSRVLSDAELWTLWAAASTTGYPYGELLRVLLLSGARLREIAEASWGEVDLEAATLTVPTNRAKMKAPHVVPLTPAALAIVQGLPRFAGGDYLFSTVGGRRPISGFSKFRARFDKALAAAGWKANAEPFIIHDLRRTVRTRLSSLGVAPHVAELVIGHAQPGLAKVYDQHRYDREKREALELWEAKLMRIVGAEPAPPATVVPMRRARVRT